MLRLSDEDKCREYLEQMRWGNSPFCPHCSSTKPYKLKDGKSYRCSNKTCKKDFTVTVGTIFENSKVKLSTWLAAIYILTGHKKGISSHQLARDLGVTQKTAWFILHRVRLIMGDPEPEPLTEIVEIDETYVGGKWANMNKKRRKQWQDKNIDNKTAVMGLKQRDGKVNLTVIGERSFKDVVKEHVDTSALVVTDSHLGYVGLSQEYKDHLTVNHSRGQYRDGIAYTNGIEGIFSIFKRTIFGTYHQISPKHLHRYCSETAYRINFRKMTDADRFRLTVSNVEGRLKYKNLIETRMSHLDK